MFWYNHMCLLNWTIFSGERYGPWASCFLGVMPFLNFEIDQNDRYYWNSLSAQVLWNCSKEFLWNFVVMKDLMYRCRYLQEILIQSFFSGSNAPFLNLDIWPKLKILLKTVCQHNSTETAQQNIVKLCGNERLNV